MFDRLTRFARRIAGRDRAPAAPPSGAVQSIADAIHRRERAAGGWASEVGVLPPAAFEGEAERMVRSISVGGGQGGAPAP